MEPSRLVAARGAARALLPAALIGAYLLVAGHQLRLPGVQYDEVLFASVAVGALENSLIYDTLGGYPLYIFPYIGALKSYLYMPIFGLFGTSPETVRLPMVLLTGLSLLLLFLAARRAFDRATALAVLALICLHPSVVMHTRADVGPNALELFFKCLALLLIFGRRPRALPLRLALVMIVLALGMFNKLNFLWFLNGLLAAIGVGMGGRILAWARRTRRWVVGLYAGWVAGFYGLMVLWSVTVLRAYNLPGVSSPAAMLERARGNLFKLLGTVGGEQFYLDLLGHDHSAAATAYAAAALLLVAAGAATLLVLRRPRAGGSAEQAEAARRRGAFLFFGALLAGTVAQLFVTTSVAGSWHYVTIFPSFALLLGASVQALARLTGRLEGPLRLGLVLLLVGLHLPVLDNYRRGIQDPQDPNWTPAIYPLVALANQRSEAFLSLDWGTHTQLVTFADDPQQRGGHREIHFALNQDLDLAGQESFALNWMNGGHLFVVRPAADTWQLEPRRMFFSLARRQGVKLIREAAVRHRGRVYYEVYRAEPPPEPQEDR